MLLRRFYDPKLAQASYLVGCSATGEALVLDANRDVAQYLRVAEAEGLRIAHVTETHIHADYVSGGRELAACTGATLYLSDEGGPHWRYAFADEARAVLLRDGDVIRVGRVELRALHTPGHTPEHLAFLLTDGAATDRPMGMFTGDFIFAGDVGRPDLLERAAHMVGTMEAGARTLFRSLRKLDALPDYLLLWPGHGAGSACGKALGAVPATTLGYERFTNWALAIADEDAFVRAVLADQPEPPRYFAEMKRVNKMGPPMLGDFRRPPRLEPGALPALLGAGAVVVDCRPAEEFARAHVPGTLNVPLQRSFPTWAGWLLPYDRELYLIAATPEQVDAAVRDLALIGLDRVAGYGGAELLEGWRAAGRTLEATPQITVAELAAASPESYAIIDVRGAVEWAAGHLSGARHIPLGYLGDHLDELPRDRTIVLQCQSGARSAIGTSLLLARGVRNVRNLVGGFNAWTAAGQPVERDAPAGAVTAAPAGR